MNTESIGAAAPNSPKMNTEVKNLLGQKFNRLTVVRFVGVSPHGHAEWECLCDCGKTKIAIGSKMKRGHTKSCGCLLAETHASRKGRKTGQRHNPLWRLWRSMLDRTRRNTCKNFPKYGGRGIEVCQEWQESYLKFEEDMGPRPSMDYSIDRIDVNKGYFKENCRWATRKQQQRNRTCNRFIEFNGDRKTITEWAESLGLTSTALRLRLEYGWTLERAMTTENQRKRLPKNGQP